MRAQKNEDSSGWLIIAGLIGLALWFRKKPAAQSTAQFTPAAPAQRQRGTMSVEDQDKVPADVPGPRLLGPPLKEGTPAPVKPASLLTENREPSGYLF